MYGRPNYNVTVKRLLLIETRDDYQDLYVRNFKLDMNYNSMHKLESVLYSNPAGANGNVSYGRIGTEIPEIVDLDARALFMASIPNGWRQKRLRFILEAETTSTTSSLTHYVQGYTDYYDPTMSMRGSSIVYGKLDPNMIFIINSILTVSRTITPDGRYVVRPFAMYNVISNMGVDSYQELQFGGDTMSLRPLDITKSILINDKFKDVMDGSGDRIISDSGNLDTNCYTSRRANADPVKYFTDSLNGYITALNSCGNTHDSTDVLASTVDNLTESNIMANPFIFNLSSVSGIISPTSFNMGMLEAMDPTVSTKATIINRSGEFQSATGMLDSGFTAPVFQPTPEAIRATIASNSITSSCVENMVTKFACTFTNESGQYVVIPTAIQTMVEGIDEMYLTQLVNRVKTHIETIVMPRITNSNMVLVTGQIQVDLFGDTTISIELNRGGSVLFRFPSYADSLYSPIIGNTQIKSGLVNDFSNAFEAATQVCGISLAV